MKKISLIFILLSAFLYAESPFFGIQTHFGQFYRADMDSLSMNLQLDLCREAGIRMIRDECLWSDVEKDSGIYVIPREVERYVRAARERNIEIYMILNYNNSIYAPGPGSGVTTQKNREAYARYCQEVVRHFAPLGVRHYEIWNEPNHGQLFWTPQPDAGDYTALLHCAYDAIKAVDSSVIVIGCATSPAIGNPPPFIEGLDFIRDVFAAGGAASMDAMSFHLYQVAYPPEKELAAYLANVKSYVGDMPIYLSEFGYPTHSAWPNISKEKQAYYISRMFLSALPDPQIRGVICYDLKNDGLNAAEAEHNFGILEFDRSPKPAYHALKTLTRHSAERRPVLKTEIADKYCLEFEDSLQILWAFQGTQNMQVPLYAKATQLENYRGQVLAYYLSEQDSVQVTIDDYPRYLLPAEKSPVFGEFVLKYHQYLFYPEESVRFAYLAADTADIPVYVDAAIPEWTFTGDCGTLQNGEFTAQDPGEGRVSVSLQGLRDSLELRVIENPGIYLAEVFDDTAGIRLQSDQLDLNASFLRNDTITGKNMLALHYRFDGSAALVYLQKPILINSLADSIYLDMYADDNIYELRLYCRDGKGSSTSVTMRPFPQDWKNTVQTLKAALDLPVSSTAPLIVEKIQIKIRPAQAQSPNNGFFAISDLRIKRGDVPNAIKTLPADRPFTLAQNYPNPFNGITRIRYTLEHPSRVRIDIIDMKGRILNTLFDAERDAGSHHLEVDPGLSASGIYFYRLSTPQGSLCRKFCFIK
ncbi:MAG: T9SS type A sorting domain-containing protein [Candidatus Marinimicrobia bacterium]|nr:T9SS type A sorting domain-containing protein [Candidatus Neomarinimicrobiota bacterium]